MTRVQRDAATDKRILPVTARYLHLLEHALRRFAFQGMMGRTVRANCFMKLASESEFHKKLQMIAS